MVMKMESAAMAALLLVAAGCATSQMKSTPFYTGSETVYTGKVEDRVNLWPIGYYREPMFSFLWPLFSVTDDHFALRPVYSQFRQDGKGSSYDEFNFLWPICQFDTKHDASRIFPFFWNDRYFDVFPFVWWRLDRSFSLFPVFFWEKDRHLNIFPLWWSDRRAKMLLPFYYQDDESFHVFPLFGRKRLEHDGFCNWYGLYGHSQYGEKRSDWCAPFYYRDQDSFSTPFFGWNRTDGSSWAFPLVYRDRKTIYSSVWCSWWDERKGRDSWFVPPLLSWGWSTDSKWAHRYLLGLAGVQRGETCDSADWLVPLYYRNDSGFFSLPWCSDSYGYTVPLLLTFVEGHGVISPILGNTGSFTYVTPFFGVVHKEHKKGGWLWPLFGWTSDDCMEKAEAQMNADRLDQKIAVEKHEKVYSKGRTNRWYAVKGAAWAHDESWRLSGLSTSDRTISWHASDDGKVVTVDEESDFGNILAYKSDYNRTVKFDYATKKKLSDGEEFESGLLCNILWHSMHEAGRGREYDMKSILWRFWHYEKRDGDVSVDSFPFFTYDAKQDGYSKVSLLWRLFRNECDPKTGRKVDFLFLPLWR